MKLHVVTRQLTIDDAFALDFIETILIFFKFFFKLSVFVRNRVDTFAFERR